MPQTTDQRERAAFEASTKWRHPAISMQRTDYPGDHGEGDYIDNIVQAKWESWQARASLAVPLVAEAPREPVGHVNMRIPSGCGDGIKWAREALPHGTPLYAALPASLAPMPEEMSAREAWNARADDLKKCVDYATSESEAFSFRALLSAHLRTAPRPTLSDEQIPSARNWLDSTSSAASRDWVEGWDACRAFAASADSTDAIGAVKALTDALGNIMADVWCTQDMDTPHHEAASAALAQGRALLAASASPQQPEQKPDSFHLAANRESAVHGLDAAAGVQEVPRG
jgi:hypothetical protein